ncbi:multiple epidermal growth factor-like domains protein 10 [Ostrea edulis]|uniref:multiple epidermal growth factor-like domains protein 10 n=1 Tax=Ostrea edulis TaxID=37623 RepID=UPI0020945293|nr:multiple epidermal growth factor-like domains protein 10 [Ostrea edulis]
MVDNDEICHAQRNKSPHGCCPQTVWNETLGICAACEPGYIGGYCNESCEYPYHGWNCRKMCSCNRSMCHYLTGCQSLEISTASNKNAPDMELLLNVTVLTTKLEVVTRNNANYLVHMVAALRLYGTKLWGDVLPVNLDT